MTSWHAPLQRNLFPDCSYKAPCNGWVVCDNCFGKSIGRTRDIVQVRKSNGMICGGRDSVSQGLRSIEMRADIVELQLTRVRHCIHVSTPDFAAAALTFMTPRVAQA